MTREISDETFKEFLNTRLDLIDFGFLVIPNDARLNEEAAEKIKASFKQFINEEA